MFSFLFLILVFVFYCHLFFCSKKEINIKKIKVKTKTRTTSSILFPHGYLCTMFVQQILLRRIFFGNYLPPSPPPSPHTNQTTWSVPNRPALMEETLGEERTESVCSHWHKIMLFVSIFSCMACNYSLPSNLVFWKLFSTCLSFFSLLFSELQWSFNFL